MIGIIDIASYLPSGRSSNKERVSQLGMDEAFLRDKIGVLRRATRAPDEETSTMALAAVENLLARHPESRSDIDALVVVTQNPDSNLPHVSARVHGLARLGPGCATFDISLGCSGYVVGLSVVQSFLKSNGLRSGILVTCDPYSKIVDPDDRNTALLFGDAATATLIGTAPVFKCGPFVFGTQGTSANALETRNGRLAMNGREVFNFASRTIPADIDRLLGGTGLVREDVDLFILHQGSRFIVESLATYARLPASRVPIGIEQIGNTVSSSIPILLEQFLAESERRTLVLSGFGVGLSRASCLIRRVKES